jgi:broad specificity phosphatase PhoE
MVYMAAYESNDTGCLAAVAHSSYLRLLLGAVTGFAAFSATSLQANCCVNVLDFARPERRRSNQLWLLPTTTTTAATNAAESSSTMTRTGKVIRVNETRHLASIPARPSALLMKA